MLTDVLEHNAQDVASLCVLLTAMVEMYRAPEKVRHDEDVFSMGVALERFQHVPEARKCYQLDERQSSCAGAGASCAELPPGRRARRGGKGLAG